MGSKAPLGFYLINGRISHTGISSPSHKTGDGQVLKSSMRRWVLLGLQKHSGPGTERLGSAGGPALLLQKLIKRSMFHITREKLCRLAGEGENNQTWDASMGFQRMARSNSVSGARTPGFRGTLFIFQTDLTLRGILALCGT
jgi:hypothetical protein